ncbi:MAG TPA: FHA domain-containing protein [Myxococcaceae bacterium]|nr:FHA domain-containing protein [Myxococcaceae bacterium]
MKSFLLSTLLPELDLRDETAFARAYPHPWLIREATGRNPAQSSAATMLMPVPVAAPRETVALAIALEPARAGSAQVTLGRGHACDVEVEEGTLSQLHCVFLHDASGWRIEDVGSTNGTWLEGVRLPPRQPQRLADGMRIQAAQLVLTFHDSNGLWRRLEAEALRP